MQSSTSGISQIWLQVRQESRKELESSLVLATSRNVLSKYGDFKPFFPQNMANLAYFSKKNPFVAFALESFSSPMVPKFATKKKNSSESKHFIYKYNFLILFKFLLNIINIPCSWCENSPHSKTQS